MKAGISRVTGRVMDALESLCFRADFSTGQVYHKKGQLPFFLIRLLAGSGLIARRHKRQRDGDAGLGQRFDGAAAQGALNAVLLSRQRPRRQADLDGPIAQAVPAGHIRRVQQPGLNRFAFTARFYRLLQDAHSLIQIS